MPEEVHTHSQLAMDTAHVIADIHHIAVYDNSNLKCFSIFLIHSSIQPLKRILHSLSCGKHKVLKRVSATDGTAASIPGEKEKASGGLIKTTDSFIFNSTFR